MKKRFLSLLLVLAMCLALLPTVALADGALLPSTGVTSITQSDVSHGDYQNQLPEGCYELAENITLTNTLTISDRVVLDLNGYSITGKAGDDNSSNGGTAENGSTAISIDGGDLTITGNGRIIGGNGGNGLWDGQGYHKCASGNGGTAIVVNEGGSLWFVGNLSITGGKGGNTERGYNGGDGGAGILVEGGSLFVTGSGSISGGTGGKGGDGDFSSGADGGNGGNGLFISGGNITISGSGSIDGGAGGQGGHGSAFGNGSAGSTGAEIGLTGGIVSGQGLSGVSASVGDGYCKVTFQNGDDVYAYEAITSGGTVNAPTDPTKADDTFVGWYEKDGDKFKDDAWDFENDTVTDAVTLYARWESETTEEENPNGLPFVWLIPGGLAGATDLTNPTFADVSHGAYYYNAVEWAYNKGVAGGVDSKHFAPDDSCTRAQAVTMLWRAAGCPDVYGANPFVDVNADDYYYEAVLWAVAMGITSGTDETHFSPDEPCTRGQIVTFLHREARCYQVHENYGFADVKTGSYCEDAVNWAVEIGITNGTSEATFSPDDTCTRAQIVTFLYRNR